MLATKLLTLKKSTTLVNMALARKLITGVVDALNINHETQQNIQLCCTEACTNIVTHGNGKSFQLDFISHADKWQVILTDDGDEFECNFGTDTVKAIDTLDLMSESGRGLAILKHCSDHAFYQHTDGINQLTLSWTKRTFAKPKLLLVEDEVVQREIYHAYLKQTYDVIESKNGKEALAIVKEEAIDLIVADINMPVMNGISLLEHVNDDDTVAAIPFVFLSALDDEETLKDVNYLGVDSFITKPINKTDLLAGLENVLTRHQKLKRKVNLQLDQKISDLLQPSIKHAIYDFKLSFESLSAQGGGGDFMFDHQLDNGDTLVVIGDVMGHDQQSKYFAHTYASYIRGLLLGIEQYPAESKTAVSKGSDITNISKNKGRKANSPIYSSVLPSLMTTLSDFVLTDKIAAQSLLTCQFLYLSKTEIVMVSAGHPPPLLLNQQGQIEKVPCEGMILGLLPGQTYQAQTISLKSNERLLCYTDGLFEAVTEPEQVTFLETQVLDAFRFSQHDSINTAKELIMTGFKQISDLPVKDDTLILLIGH